MIKRLESSVASRIAAGEVIERPASMAKELIENSIDAGAESITLRLEQGGKFSFVIEDDGSGISFSELPLALERYATSKINSLEDLEKIATLGYRGEALASIAAVSRMEIRSRTEEAESGGVIRSEGGKVLLHAEAPCQKGTRIQADDLFYNLPARRKFLKSSSAELRRVIQIVNDYALMYPFITFRVFNDGKKNLEHFAATSIEERLKIKWGEDAKVYSARTAKGANSVTLWWSPAPDTRRTVITLFVNGRRVQDSAVRAAIYANDASPNGEWIVALATPPEEVDVNIHPTKEEIRFRRAQDVFKAVHEAACDVFAEYHGATDPTLELAYRPSEGQIKAENSLFDRNQKLFSQKPWKAVAPQDKDRVASNSAETVFIPAEKPQKYSYDPDSSADKHKRAVINKDREIDEQPRTENFIANINYIGQTARGFLLYDFPGRLAILDPHAAHERILYEEIAASFKDSVNVQKLALPLEIPKALLAEAKVCETELKKLSFTIEGGKLTGVPALTGRGRLSPVELLRSALRGLEVETDPEKRDREVWWRWARIACRDAVKLTTKMEREEAEQLLIDLQKCGSPWTCPHGRPVIFFIDDQKLEAWFDR